MHDFLKPQRVLSYKFLSGMLPSVEQSSNTAENLPAISIKDKNRSQA